jgi:PleD family two-component response regulator
MLVDPRRLTTQKQSVTIGALARKKAFGQTIAMQNLDQILVVEDDKAIRELVAKFLSENGFRVTKAANWIANSKAEIST